MIKNILFDLDGTLLPMDMEKFTQGYFKRLVMKAAPHGYEPEKLMKSIWAGTAAMVKNNGGITNEEAFWNKFSEIYGEEKAGADKPMFDEYYRKEFSGVREDCGFDPAAAETVKTLKEKGFALVLATNPIFPAVATEIRVEWAGLDKNDFLLYTAYENSHYCKPNPKYYEEILKRLHMNAEECLMVGNDVNEDMVAETLGMKVFLLTDCLLNKDNKDISAYPHGGFPELLNFVEELR